MNFLEMDAVEKMMAFSDDGGGFKFECGDAKMSLGSSTWNTRLSQIGRVAGQIYVVTRLLPGTDYISKIIAKRPRDIFIVANSEARKAAKVLKDSFPNIRIALHNTNNARVVLAAPETVWISGDDFGESTGRDWIGATVGLHSADLFRRTHEELFKRLWTQSEEIG